MRSDKFFDAGAFLLIVGLGLATAWICFGVLNSQANGRFEGYSLGGAIVGAIVSWGFLTTIYLKVQKSTNELEDLRKKSANEIEDLRKKSNNDLEDLRKQNKTLEDKLIRGAPCPRGFDIEVDERQRIVLARPQEWEPKGGIIFQLESPEQSQDKFAAAFQCSFLPIDRARKLKQPAQDYYHSQLEYLEGLVKNGYVESYSKEFARLGGEADSAESLKVIAHQFARVWEEKEPGNPRGHRSWSYIRSTEFFGWINAAEPWHLTAGHPRAITLKGTGFHRGAKCTVNTQSRTTNFLGPGAVEVILEPEDVASPGNLRLAVVNPEANGRASNPVWLTVFEAPHDQPVASEAPNIEGAKQVSREMALPEKPKEAPAAAEPESRGRKSANPAETPHAEEPTEKEAFLEIMRMTVICYHEALEKIFFFEFWDDSKDFLKSSDDFNRILASARFLN